MQTSTIQRIAKLDQALDSIQDSIYRFVSYKGSPTLQAKTAREISEQTRTAQTLQAELRTIAKHLCDSKIKSLENAKHLNKDFEKLDKLKNKMDKYLIDK